MCAEKDLAAGLVVFRLVPATQNGTGDSSSIPKQEIQYLLLQKKEEHRRHNWGPPKGYAKAGESDENCALRETHEETGLTDNDLSVLTDFEIILSYIAWRRRKRVRFWPARLVDPEKSSIRISQEHNEYRWIGINDAVELVFGKDMKAELQKCDVYLKNLYGID